MFKTLKVTIKPMGARATPKAARPIPSIALIMLMALVTPAAIEAAAASAALLAPPPVPPVVANAPPAVRTASRGDNPVRT